VHVKADRFPNWPPVILGHEFSGTVIELGPECQYAANRRPRGGRAAHAALRPVLSVPHRQCANLPEQAQPGLGIHGSMAPLLVMPEKLLHRIPDSMDFDTAAVVEPTANAYTTFTSGPGGCR